MRYKNLSRTSKTFGDVTFQPGEVKEFPGLLNHPSMFLTNDEVTAKADKPAKVSKPAEKPKEEKPAEKPAESNKDNKPKEEKPNGKHSDK